MLAIKRSVGVAPGLNLMNTLHTGKEAHHGLKPRADVTGSPEQTLQKEPNVLQNLKNFKKKIITNV